MNCIIYSNATKGILFSKKTIDIKQYERFFEVNYAGFLLVDIYSEVYKDIGILAINFNNRLRIYLNRTGTKVSRNIGKKMYLEKDYEEYIRDFNLFINDFDLNFQKLKSFEPVEIEYFFQQVVKFLNFYRYTEFFYTDYIFDPSNKDKYKIQQSAVEVIKNRGRLLLNKIFIAEKAYLRLVLLFLTNKFHYPSNILFNFSQQELVNLSKGFLLDKDLLKDRFSDYYFLASGKKNILIKTLKIYLALLFRTCLISIKPLQLFEE